MMKCPLTLCVFIILIFWISNGVESLPHHQQDNHHDHHDHAETRKLSKNKPLDFAMHLLDDLHHEAAMDENIIMSPLSIFTALFVTCSGAAGKTREELGKYLSISANEEESKKQLSSMAESLKQILLKKDPSFVESSLAVGLFIQKDFPIHPEFIKAAKTQFSAHVANVDFSENGATNGINKFISDATKNRIPSLFESPLDSQTQVVLVNTLYFQGIWKESFVAANTKLEKFHTGVKDVQVQMMNNKQFVPYYDNPALKFEAIQIPYHDDYYMAIVLPYKEQTLMNLTHHLSGDDLNEALYNANTVGIDYKIPRMKFSWSKSLKSTLEKDGLHSMFEKADFGKMTLTNKLTVSDVKHAAEIDVNEEGTTAAAVTVVSFSTYSLKPTPYNPKPFYANRPFMMAIYHRSTSIVLFAALVHQPNGAAA